MAVHNNHLVGQLPSTPYPELERLEPLIGKWHVETEIGMDGYATFEWMEGGFFLIQRFHFATEEETIKGIEYTGFDEDTQTLRSHMMDTQGHNFTYTWDIIGDNVWYWFGDRDSDRFSHGKLSKDGKTIAGRWQWREPNGQLGGYNYTMTKVDGG